MGVIGDAEYLPMVIGLCGMEGDGQGTGRGQTGQAAGWARMGWVEWLPRNTRAGRPESSAGPWKE